MSFFNGDGSGHPRLDAELEKAKQISMQRRINGAKGGFRSAVARRKDELWDRANRLPIGAPNDQANASAIKVAKMQPPDTQSQSHIKHPTSSLTARERETGSEIQSHKRPNDCSRADLDQVYARKREARFSDAPA